MSRISAIVLRSLLYIYRKDADKISATNIGMMCNGKRIFHLVHMAMLGWSLLRGPSNCRSGQYICGLRTKVDEPYLKTKDNTGLNEAEFACCQNIPVNAIGNGWC